MAFDFALALYESFQAPSPAEGEVTLNSLSTLGVVFASVVSLKIITNGRRIYAASVAPPQEKLSRLTPLSYRKKREKIESPSLRFLTFLPALFVTSPIILGTYGVLTASSPIGEEVLMHYVSMTLGGMALLIYSWNEARFEGVDPSAPEISRLLGNARPPAVLSPRSKLTGIKLRILGLTACILGVVMALDSFVLFCYKSAQSLAMSGISEWWFFCTIYGLFGSFLGGYVYNAGQTLLRHSRRHLSEIIPSPDYLNGESFVLYLRPFKNDSLHGDGQRIRLRGGPLQGFVTSGRSEEEQLATALKRLGSMVGVGAPGEKLPNVGASRMYLPGDDWKEPVLELIKQARLVVLALGPGEGTMWELYEAMRILQPEQLILVVPMRRKEYDQFRKEATEKLRARVAQAQSEGEPLWSPPSLPDYTGNEQMPTQINAVIYFSSGWKPTFVRLEISGLFRLSGFRLHVALKIGLRPAFNQLISSEQRFSVGS